MSDRGGASTLSVAMCTFNGARFLPEQLDSIAAQTRLPEELVVCDDGSTDDTVSVAEAFARTAPFPVRVLLNERRLGFTRNFTRAISLCTGDLIALSDQDDVWHPDKLAFQEHTLRSEAAGAVFTDADVVDADLNPLGYRLWDSVGFSGASRRVIRTEKAPALLLKQDVVTGATLMFRAHYRDAVLPMPAGWFHDGWIALVVAALGKITFIPAALVKYRQHSNNEIGALPPLTTTAGFLRRLAAARAWDSDLIVRHLARYEAAAERLPDLIPLGVDPALIADAETKVAHLRERINLPRKKLARTRVVLKELVSGRYRRYSAGLRSAGKDLLLR
jgi:glycosyltransferase involved in cell wall biosynthesis